MDFSRLRTGEIVAGAAGLALLIFMFFDWFEGAAAFEGEAEGVSGWDALADWDGFLVLLAGLSGVALALLAASGQRLNLGGLPRGAGTAVFGSLAALMILWRVLLQETDAEFGAYLGLAAAIALAVGALMALRDGGFEPLLAVAGGRTRAASEAPTTTAPAATPARRAAGGSTRSGSSPRSGSRSGGSKSTGSRSGGSRSSSRSSSSKSTSSKSSSSKPSSKSSSSRSGSSRSGSSSRGRSAGRK